MVTTLIPTCNALSTTKNFEEELAEGIRKYPRLSDSSRREHNDVQETTSSWREIAVNLSVHKALCRQKLNKSRDRFTKAKKRINSRSGDAVVKSIPEIYISNSITVYISVNLLVFCMWQIS